ncbi:MAG: response regulator transcription factor [Anaerolineae bacterium]|jgi:two-component system alkaline phosphatase synthesis response regulator PhoP|nr:response regulator transcription factor [Anaerolineae bacterium]
MAERVLIVEDDKEIARVLRAYLEQAGYEVAVAHNGLDAIANLNHHQPSLILLDLMLPDKDGLDITRYVRANLRLAGIYILMLTARVEDMDKIIGLEVGADDYVTKPFNPREVVARVRAAFRRLQEADPTPDILRYRNLAIDMTRRWVTLNEQPIELTPMEYHLLVTLMQRQGIPFSRAELIQRRTGYDYDSLERTLDSHIRNLRKKIEPDPKDPIYVQTVYGYGYRLGDPQ